MARKEASYADLVYDVLRSSPHPLSFPEIYEAVDRRRPVTTRQPKATIRNALSQSHMLVSLGDGRYGYLPHLVQGALLRVPLTAKKPANQPLVLPDEVRHALWPDRFEIQKRKLGRPALLQLPNGVEVSVPLEHFGSGVWGISMPEDLRRFLVESRAAAGDSLLIHVVDGETGRAEVRFERRYPRDATAVDRRNQELADAAYGILRGARTDDVPIWDLTVLLLGRGHYRAEVAADVLEAVLRSDLRFADAGWAAWMLAERLTSETAETVRRRKDSEDSFLPAAPAIAAGAGQTPSPLAVGRAMERSFADIGAILSRHEFASMDEANALLQDMVSRGGPPRRVARTPLEQAQDIMYDAWEEPERRDRIRLAREALEISPDCADAYVLLAEETAPTAKNAAELFEKGVAAGERALGSDAFEKEMGHFWGIIETRPYMRARFGLAEALWASGKRGQAIAHAWDLIRLNPGDNQGVRSVLISWLLQMGEQASVERLLDLFSEDPTAQWLFARALHAFQVAGDTEPAREALASATRGNPHVAAFLLGRRKRPRILPETIGFGDESEAIACAVEQMAAWRSARGALAWLAGHARTNT